ncbi:uncharacterized protein LOC125494897 [Beta vulgaris subsp. vulgaris]|uniref:uncharacterized protein LOC125494897 n=1 Tax=Beta vulgaris subsp. vulgaris TaxID=3555 RepID=UPI00203736E1|nr:uncharacterized protein LOC125494897 [Beta vulgaris subsp. vulgaris]
MKGSSAQVHWDMYIWNMLNVLKHRFISWLVIQYKLTTIDRLLQIGVVNAAPYQFCASGIESHEHLFFRCTYASSILEAMKNWLGIETTETSNCRLLHFMKNNRSTKFRKNVISVVYNGIVYSLWWARNEAVWNMTVWNTSGVVKKIKQMVVNRIKSVNLQKMSSSDKQWLESLYNTSV